MGRESEDRNLSMRKVQMAYIHRDWREGIEGVDYVWDCGRKVPISGVSRQGRPTVIEEQLKATAKAFVTICHDAQEAANLPKRGPGRPKGQVNAGTKKALAAAGTTTTHMHLRCKEKKPQLKRSAPQIPKKKTQLKRSGPQIPKQKLKAQRNRKLSIPSESNASRREGRFDGGNTAEQSEGCDIGGKLTKTMLQGVAEQIGILKAELDRSLHQAQRTCRKLQQLEEWIMDTV